MNEANMLATAKANQVNKTVVTVFYLETWSSQRCIGQTNFTLENEVKFNIF